jgi:hypothetical protein
VEARDDTPRLADEWRIEIALEEDQHGASLSKRLHALRLDDEARKRLGGSVVVTRDGRFMFIYARHEPSAVEAERVVRELMEEDDLAGEVKLTRWHPIAEEWRPAEEALPDDEMERLAEEERHQAAGAQERREFGDFPWQVLIDLPDRRRTLEFTARLRKEGLSVERHWKYLLVGADTEDAAVELGRRLEGEAPEGSQVGIRGNPDEMPLPAFIQLGSLEPGFLRDLGI